MKSTLFVGKMKSSAWIVGYVSMQQPQGRYCLLLCQKHFILSLGEGDIIDIKSRLLPIEKISKKNNTTFHFDFISNVSQIKLNARNNFEVEWYSRVIEAEFQY